MQQKKWTNTDKFVFFFAFKTIPAFSQTDSSRLQPSAFPAFQITAPLTEGVLEVLLSHQFEVFLYGLCR